MQAMAGSEGMGIYVTQKPPISTSKSFHDPSLYLSFQSRLAKIPQFSSQLIGSFALNSVNSSLEATSELLSSPS